MSQAFKMKLVISCYISSFLLCKAQYRPRYKTDGKRGGKQDEDERKEAGVKVCTKKKKKKKRTVEQLGEVSCLVCVLC